MRARLREATAAVHQRLHGHEGFAAVSAGAVSMADYRALLERLWGFHKAFETALAGAGCAEAAGFDLARRARSGLIEQDLTRLGADAAGIALLETCPDLPPPKSLGETMGALYVVEGSTLGGQQIARALAPLFNARGEEGCRFFLGHGEAHSAMWRAFLIRLEECAREPGAAQAMIDGAVVTFAVFEEWMSGWKQPAPECSADPRLVAAAE